MNKLLATLALVASLIPQFVLAATPTILDTLPATKFASGIGVSASGTYTVPAGGTNTIEIVTMDFGGPKGGTFTATQNGVAMTCGILDETTARAAFLDYCYLVAPTTGTLSISWSGSNGYGIFAYTLKDAAQVSPIDVVAQGGSASGLSSSVTINTNVGNDALVDMTATGAITITDPVGQTTIVSSTLDGGGGGIEGSFKAAGTAAAAETMTQNYSGSTASDIGALGIKVAATAPTFQFWPLSLPFQ